MSTEELIYKIEAKMEAAWKQDHNSEPNQFFREGYFKAAKMYEETEVIVNDEIRKLAKRLLSFRHENEILAHQIEKIKALLCSMEQVEKI